MTQPWFRFYRGVVNNPKVQRLPPQMFKLWVNLLCCTNDEGELPPIGDLAFSLRLTEKQVEAAIGTLSSAGLLSVDADFTVTAHDWSEHQRKSDTSNERVKRHRELRRNVTRNTPETETEEEAEKKEVKAASAPPKTPPSTASSDDYPDELDAAVSAYNTAAEACKWPTCQRLTSPRIRHLTARLAEVGGIDGWRLAMERASKSSFLRGETGRSGQHSNWRCDLDFLLQQSSFTKLMEGKYDDAPRLNGQHGQPQPGHRTPGQTERDRQLAIALAGAGVGRV